MTFNSFVAGKESFSSIMPEDFQEEDIDHKKHIGSYIVKAEDLIDPNREKSFITPFKKNGKNKDGYQIPEDANNIEQEENNKSKCEQFIAMKKSGVAHILTMDTFNETQADYNITDRSQYFHVRDFDDIKTVNWVKMAYIAK